MRPSRQAPGTYDTGPWTRTTAGSAPRSRDDRACSYLSSHESPARSSRPSTRGATSATAGSSRCRRSRPSQPGTGSTSESTKATYGVRTRASPALRAAAGPALRSNRTTSARVARTGSLDASSTTTTGMPVGSDRSNRASSNGRSRTGITTVTSATASSAGGGPGQHGSARPRSSSSRATRASVGSSESTRGSRATTSRAGAERKSTDPDRPVSMAPLSRTSVRRDSRTPKPDGGSSSGIIRRPRPPPGRPSRPAHDGPPRPRRRWGRPARRSRDTARTPSLRSAGISSVTGRVSPGSSRSTRTASGATCSRSEVSVSPACASDPRAAQAAHDAARPSARRRSTADATVGALPP